MLLRGRIDLIWFERGALNRALNHYPQRPPVYFRQFPEQSVPMVIAVRRSPKGERLKAALEQLLAQPDALDPPQTLIELQRRGQAGVIEPGK